MHNEVVELFEVYRDSYNLRLKREDAETVKKYAYEIKKIADNKE